MSGSRKADVVPVDKLKAVLSGLAALAIVAVLVGFLVLSNRGAPDDGDSGRMLPSASKASGPAEDFAAKVLQTWSQPDLAYDEWWAQVSPLLTPGAREAYAMTNPALVPRLAWLERPKLEAGPSTNTVTVYFDTGAGRFGVDISRADESSSWRAHRVVFPEQESVFS